MGRPSQSGDSLAAGPNLQLAARPRGVTVGPVVEQSYMLATPQTRRPCRGVRGLARVVNRVLCNAILRSTADIKVAGGSGGLGKLLHKLMVIDDQLTVFGSFNHTKPTNRSNDENIVIVGDLEKTKASARAKEARIALVVRAEIDRIIVEYGNLLRGRAAARLEFLLR